MSERDGRTSYTTIEDTAIGYVINFHSPGGTITHCATGFKSYKECEDHLKGIGERYYTKTDWEVKALMTQMNELARRVMCLSMGNTTMTYKRGVIDREANYNMHQMIGLMGYKKKD